MAKIAILPGIFSGKHTARPLRRALEAAGHKVVSSTTQADVILAHSAGCLWIPQIKTAQMLVLVDPPYWPGKSMAKRVCGRARSNSLFWRYGVTPQHWVTRNLLGLYYAVREPRRTLHIMRHMGDYDLEQTVQLHPNVTLVRNAHDDWLTPDLDSLQKAYPTLQIVRLPGEHDDFNYNPQRYADLVQSVA